MTFCHSALVCNRGIGFAQRLQTWKLDGLSRVHAVAGGSQEARGAYSGLSLAHNDIRRVVL
jgi:hypothetical protein